jgi:hypothetical protein
MAIYQKPFTINQEFNTNDYLTNDTELTKREGNTLFITKANEGSSWEDFVEYIRDTYGLEFSLDDSPQTHTVITGIADVDIALELTESTDPDPILGVSRDILISRTTGIYAPNYITSPLFVGDLTGTASTSTSATTSQGYSPASGIDTTITTLTNTGNINLAEGLILTAVSGSFWTSVSGKTLTIADTATLTENGNSRLIVSSGLAMFNNALQQITMDDDFKIYVYDNRSTYVPANPYNRIVWSNYAFMNYTYLYFGQYDDTLVSEPSNDYPFLRLSTNFDNVNFVGYALNSQDEFQSNRGSWTEASRFNVLRMVYQGNPTIGGGGSGGSENFCVSYGSTNRVLTIHSAVITVAQFDNDITATGSKAFIIDHPVDTTPRKKLRHACVESSEVKNIYRDTVSVVGSCIINLDAHFGMTNGTMCALNKNISASVSNNATFDNAIGYLEGNELHIEVETDEPTTISFIVWGTRQDDNIKKGKTTDDNGDLITEFYKVRDDE